MEQKTLLDKVLYLVIAVIIAVVIGLLAKNCEGSQPSPNGPTPKCSTDANGTCHYPLQTAVQH